MKQWTLVIGQLVLTTWVSYHLGLFPSAFHVLASVLQKRAGSHIINEWRPYIVLPPLAIMSSIPWAWTGPYASQSVGGFLDINFNKMPLSFDTFDCWCGSRNPVWPDYHLPTPYYLLLPRDEKKTSCGRTKAVHPLPAFRILNSENCFGGWRPREARRVVRWFQYNGSQQEDQTEPSHWAAQWTTATSLSQQRGSRTPEQSPL